MMRVDDAIRSLRSDPLYSDLVRDSYLGEDLQEAWLRFLRSAEFQEAKRLLAPVMHGGVVLDLGAGNGIASGAFARSGVAVVYALDPCSSEEVGRGAILRMKADLPIEVLDGYGESIPLPDESVDVVYARQVLHHTRDLEKVLAECRRVLRIGGLLLACREHVVDDDGQLRSFLDTHPLHRLCGGENAFPLHVYLRAVRLAGLEIVRVLGPWDTVINAFPAVRSTEELRRFPRILLERRFGRPGLLASFFPPVRWLVWRRVRRPVPGRLYSFLARKPSRGVR